MIKDVLIDCVRSSYTYPFVEYDGTRYWPSSIIDTAEIEKITNFAFVKTVENKLVYENYIKFEDCVTEIVSGLFEVLISSNNQSEDRL